MDRRIRRNGLAHSPKWTSACMIHHTCEYIRAGWKLLRLGTPPGPGAGNPWGPRLKSLQPSRIHTHVWCIMHALVHFGECANPFWRMRLSILSNLHISGIRVSRVQHNDNNNNNGALVARGGPERSLPTIRHNTLKDRRKGDP